MMVLFFGMQFLIGDVYHDISVFIPMLVAKEYPLPHGDPVAFLDNGRKVMVWIVHC